MKPIWFCQPIRMRWLPRDGHVTYFSSNMYNIDDFTWGNTGKQWIVIFQFSETPMGIEMI